MNYFLLLFLFLFPVSAFSQVKAEADSLWTNNRRFTLGSVHIHGNKKTRESVILRELSVKPGEKIAADSLAEIIKINRQRLESAGLFTEISIRTDTVSPEIIRWNIYLEERWYIIPEFSFQLADQNFNVWWNEHDRDLRRTIIGIKLSHKNFRGNMETLGITAQVGYVKKLGIDYSIPYIDKSQKHGMGFSAAIMESQETFYATDSNKLRFVKLDDKYILRQYEASVAYLWRPAYASRHLFRIGYLQTLVDDTVTKLNPGFFRNGSNRLEIIQLSYRLEQNKTDNWNYPLTGTKIIAQGFYRFGFKGLEQQLTGTLELGRYYDLKKKWYFSSVLRGKVSFPENPPYYLNTALGSKYDYVRGYEYYVIDGPDFGLLRVNLKKEILNISFKNLPLKYLSAIPLKIYPKIFADAGYVHNPYGGNSFLNNRLLYSGGIGLDIFTAYDIKIRLEYAWNHLGQKDLFLHLNSE